MNLAAGGFSGRVTFLAGAGKGSGKTTLLNYALGLMRDSGESAAFLGIGFDGEQRAGARLPRIACRRGEVFVTASQYLAISGCRPEVLDVLPGSSPLGRLAIVRARRDGEVVLVGCERNDYTARAIETIRGEGWALTVLVDGAMSRITQVSAFPGARFVFTVRALPGDLEGSAAAVRRLAALADLPVVGAGSGAHDNDASAAGLPTPACALDDRASAPGPPTHGCALDDDVSAAGLPTPACAPDYHASAPGLPTRGCALDNDVSAAGLPTPACALDGPLTATTLERVPAAARTIVVDDFTKVFLDASALGALRRERVLAVRTGVEFAGFVVTLRDVSRARFLAALDDPAAAEMIAFNPYEVGAAEGAAGVAA